MADFELKPEEKAAKKRKRRNLRSDEEEPGPSKASRTDHSERERKEEKEETEQMGTSGKPDDGPPWGNLKLILSLQNKDIDLQKKVGLAFNYVKSRVREEGEGISQGLEMKIFSDKLDGGELGVFGLQLSCFVLEPFAKFLRVHPTRKNGFHDFIDKLLEPLLHLLDVLPLYIHGSSPGWTRNLLKLVEEVLSQGLFHPSHIDGFLSLQSMGKYMTSNDGKPKDLKTFIKSYHRHLFDKLEKIMAGKNELAIGGVGELFHLFVDCVKKQKGASEKSHFSSSVNAEARKSLFEFFVQITGAFDTRY
ncbi:hypothetical protein F0562_020480 [Nyssa sinensis]|uniref:Uncharacterized protein n=1 Tax=Nyssa sinensis TaxID=561372 RepID=A0A5J5BT24_9ASTE|nr:hypothetical protein F0562_020480 [Nyssa sinensis]